MSRYVVLEDINGHVDTRDEPGKLETFSSEEAANARAEQMLKDHPTASYGVYKRVTRHVSRVLFEKIEEKD